MILFEFESTSWLKNELSPRFRGRLSFENDLTYKSELSFEDTPLNVVYSRLTSENIFFKDFKTYWDEVFLDLFSNDELNDNYWLYAAHFCYVPNPFMQTFTELIKNELDKHTLDKSRICSICYRFDYLK